MVKLGGDAINQKLQRNLKCRKVCWRLANQLLNEASGLVGSLDANLLVEVYVDGGGTVQDSDAAWELSLRRADRVARFATGMGLGGPNLRIMGYGERAAPEGSEPERSELLRLTILSGDSDSHRFL